VLRARHAWRTGLFLGSRFQSGSPCFYCLNCLQCGQAPAVSGAVAIVWPFHSSVSEPVRAGDKLHVVGRDETAVFLKYIRNSASDSPR